MEVLREKNDRSFHDLGCRVPGLAGGAVSTITRASNDKEKGLIAVDLSFPPPQSKLLASNDFITKV